MEARKFFHRTRRSVVLKGSRGDGGEGGVDLNKNGPSCGRSGDGREKRDDLSDGPNGRGLEIPVSTGAGNPEGGSSRRTGRNIVVTLPDSFGERWRRGEPHPLAPPWLWQGEKSFALMTGRPRKRWGSSWKKPEAVGIKRFLRLPGRPEGREERVRQEEDFGIGPEG